jgi:hypothetical protein
VQGDPRRRVEPHVERFEQVFPELTQVAAIPAQQ